MGHAAEVVQDCIDVRYREAGRRSVPEQNLLVLENEWNRQGDVEPTTPNLRQQPEGNTTS